MGTARTRNTARVAARQGATPGQLSLRLWWKVRQK